MAKVIAHKYQLKRGTAARWLELNPILSQGEPGFEYDTYKLKIGDGTTPWLSLPYVNEEVIAVSSYAELPAVGDENILYKVNEDKCLYQWNEEELIYEKISGGSEVDIDSKNNVFEVLNLPEKSILNTYPQEIRILCPKDTVWNEENSRIKLMIRMPEEVVGLREGDDGTINKTVFIFNDENSETNKKGRFHIYWLTIASQTESGNWEYKGKNSTIQNYNGWTYKVEWYNENNDVIGFDSVRINLSNEDCHYINEPYYVNNININQILQTSGEYITLYGGSATENL